MSVIWKNGDGGGLKVFNRGRHGMSCAHEIITNLVRAGTAQLKKKIIQIKTRFIRLIQLLHIKYFSRNSCLH